MFTRSGNTATPDDTWSAWSGPYAVSEGEEIKSPNARYLQWKAVLTGKQATPDPDIGVCRLRSAQSASEGHEPDGASVRHGVPEAISDGRSGYRRIRGSGARSPDPQLDRESRQRIGSGAGPPRLSAWSADVRMARRRRQRRRIAVRDPLSPRRGNGLEVV